MHFNSIHDEYYPSSFLKVIQIFLLVLIIVGIGLLATQKIWVPKLVEYILSTEESLVTQIPVVTQSISATTTNTVKPESSTTPVTRPGKIATGVEGIATIGPTCPVVRFPDDGSCADKPYETTLVIANNLPGKGGGILVRTNVQGYFSQELAPGTYTIRAQSETIMPRLSPVTFEVTSNERVSLNLQFDSGIR